MRSIKYLKFEKCSLLWWLKTKNIQFIFFSQFVGSFSLKCDMGWRKDDFLDCAFTQLDTGCICKEINSIICKLEHIPLKTHFWKYVLSTYIHFIFVTFWMNIMSRREKYTSCTESEIMSTIKKTIAEISLFTNNTYLQRTKQL